MCGIAGYIDLAGTGRVERERLAAMTEVLVHRGPDSSGYHLEPGVGLGVRRLKIIDLATGDQPIYNEDRTLALVCNGEIFNFRELRAELLARGHVFRTGTDVEVLVHLYEDVGDRLLDRLNGQFAFALYDRRRRRLLLARDHFGVNPLFYCRAGGLLLFGSEIKALLAHPAVERRVDLVGLDQVLSLPGLVSPRTLFAGVESLGSGHALAVEDGRFAVRQYWDLTYPEDGGADEPVSAGEEARWVEELGEILQRSVGRRLQSDVPLGLCVSGGIDSSLVAALAARQTAGAPPTFSVAFADAEIDEAPYQRLMARALGGEHHEIRVDLAAIASSLSDMVYHAECPVKESYNTCAMALAGEAKAAGVSVLLGGEGADELFGGYLGYRFDRPGGPAPAAADLDALLEEELRERLWGDRRLVYEKDQLAFREVKTALYSRPVAARFGEIDCLGHPLVDVARLRNRHILNRRSYLDFKLRLADHLLADHGDRMVMARSVEGRYPFLDLEVVDFARRLPAALKVKGFTEKYVVKRLAAGLVPRAIVERDKFGFRAPASPEILRAGGECFAELLSEERIQRHGVFDPAAVAKLKRQYGSEEFRLHPHLETDLLMVVLTFNLLCERFGLSGVGA